MVEVEHLGRSQAQAQWVRLYSTVDPPLIDRSPEIDDQWAAAGVRLLQPGSAPRDCRFLVAPVPHWECSAHQIPPAARGRGEHARSEVDVTALPPQVAIGARGSTVSAPSAAYETVCVVAARSPRVFYCCYAQ
jgi:hypothetical protein